MPPLDEYRRKRDFSRTPEPAPGSASGVAPGTAADSRAIAPFALRRRFVVGRHRASRLHYDLRLEIDGVLVSWAVPRGPTLDPDARRAAFRTEDHPIEYLDFEGVIPKGSYGAGDAIVWDWGHWEPERETPDPAAALAAGELKLRFDGLRLRGRATIVRTGGKTRDAANEWLLIHKRDAEAVAGWDAEDHPTSICSGRTNEEVLNGVAPRFTAPPPPGGIDPDLAPAVRAAMPAFVEPMLATPASAVPRGADWIYELKWDGYRTQALVRGGRAELRSRNGIDAGGWFPRLRGAATWIDADEAVVDGEAVALDEAGRPDFSLLGARLGDPAGGVVLMAFDLLHLDGWSLLAVPLEARRSLLARRLREDPRVRLSAHADGDGQALFDAAAAQGLEGIVAKRRRSPYAPGRRSSDWVKRKARPGQELVVGGWTPESASGAGLGALAVGVWEDGALRFAGMVGSGFDARSRRELLARLDALETEAPPFDPVPAGVGRGRSRRDLSRVRWVRPELVVSVASAGWTAEGHVRQASYKGLLADRDARAVVRERLEAVADPVASPAATPAPSPPPAASATAEALAELAAMPAGGRWSIGGRELGLTNLDKVLFAPREGSDEAPVTKRELIGYFARVAAVMLPHLAGRPLNLHRFPDGAGRPGFWQKQVPATAPAWLTRWREPGFEAREDRAPNDHLVADGVAALCWLGNQAAFEVHAWTSTCADPWRPTYALIDIDPGTATTWAETLVLARLFRTALDHLGVRAYPKVTGGRGLHAWIPLERGRYTFAETSAWVETLSRAVGAAVPDLVSWEWAKRDRSGRARLDYTQNQPVKTLVAPYAVRPAAGAPVSAPIGWDELDDPGLLPDRWTVRTVLERIAQRGDPWAELPDDRQVLPAL